MVEVKDLPGSLTERRYIERYCSIDRTCARSAVSRIIWSNWAAEHQSCGSAPLTISGSTYDAICIEGAILRPLLSNALWKMRSGLVVSTGWPSAAEADGGGTLYQYQ